MYLQSFENTRNLSKEKKKRKAQDRFQRYKNFPEDEKQKLVEYR